MAAPTLKDLGVAERGLIFVNNEFIEPANGKYLPIVNPATEEVMFQMPLGGKPDVDKAVEAAREAFDSWSNTPPAERARYLNLIADEVEKNAAKLAQIEVLDNGKPKTEAEGDIADVAGTFRYYAKLITQIPVTEKVEHGQADVYLAETERVAIGVVGAIVPWNYPLLMATWKLAPAIAAGCTIVLKPSELTPISAIEFGKIVLAVGLPKGVVNIVPGLGAEAGEALSTNKGVDKISFTGSVPTGRRIMMAASAGPIPVTLELGGKSPLVLLEDALSGRKDTIEWISFGIFFNQGQVCSATSRVLAPSGISEEVLKQLVAHAEAIKVGDGFAEDTKMGPIVSKGQYEKIQRYIRDAVAAGAKLVTGGPDRPADLKKGYFLRPTILTGVKEDMAIWTEEVFGPVLAVMEYSSVDEAVRLANQTEYGLACAVMSGDPAKARQVASKIRAGIKWINCSQPTLIELPWGGLKKSGFGKDLGVDGLNAYLTKIQLCEHVASEPFKWY
ncbi:aldehyde dehydrogenase domain-containing protein [Hyaloraphidium curvatum]|nr:aldehyde dehydrogenase domain-containing protein [Hyaloraphidium curvatum]